MQPTVGIYCRISVDRLGRKEGVDAQEKWGRDYSALTWPGLPIRVFADNNLSAASDDIRPNFELLRAAIVAGEIGRLWCVEQSRLERREVEWFRLAAELDTAGIPELHTNRDGIVRVRDEVAGIKAVINAGEVRKLKLRVNDRLDEIAAEGRPPGAVVFGYTHGRDKGGGKTLHQVPEQSAAIRWAAEKVLAGWSLTNITRHLIDDLGMRGGHGGALTPAGVKKILTNPTIAGHRVHRGRVVGRGVWDPILDETLWQAVRLRLSKPRTVTRSDGGTHPIGPAAIGSRTARKYLLTGGLAVCGVCRHPMTGTVKQFMSGGTKVAKPYLLCSTTRGGGGCTGILLLETEQYVADTLFDELDKPEFLDAIAADEHAERRDGIVAALGVVDRRRGVLAALWTQPGQLTTEEWQTARDGLAAQERQLRAELTTIPAPLVGINIEGAREAWPEMTLDEKRELLRLFVERVTIQRARPGTKSFDSGRVEIEWRRR